MLIYRLFKKRVLNCLLDRLSDMLYNVAECYAYNESVESKITQRENKSSDCCPEVERQRMVGWGVDGSFWGYGNDAQEMVEGVGGGGI